MVEFTVYWKWQFWFGEFYERIRKIWGCFYNEHVAMLNEGFYRISSDLLDQFGLTWEERFRLFIRNDEGRKEKKNKQFSCPFAGWNWKKAKSLSTRSHARWRGEAAAWWGPRAASRAASRRRMGLRLLPDEERRDPVPTAAAAPRLVDRTLS